jgi:hypothetical protein
MRLWLGLELSVATTLFRPAFYSTKTERTKPTSPGFCRVWSYVMMKFLIFLIAILALSACAPHHQSDDWGALWQQVGRQLNK